MKIGSARKGASKEDIEKTFLPIIIQLLNDHAEEIRKIITEIKTLLS